MDLEQKIVAIKIVYCTGAFIFAVIANMIDTENSKWSRKGKDGSIYYIWCSGCCRIVWI